MKKLIQLVFLIVFLSSCKKEEIVISGKIIENCDGKPIQGEFRVYNYTDGQKNGRYYSFNTNSCGEFEVTIDRYFVKNDCSLEYDYGTFYTFKINGSRDIGAISMFPKNRNIIDLRVLNSYSPNDTLEIYSNDFYYKKGYPFYDTVINKEIISEFISGRNEINRDSVYFSCLYRVYKGPKYRIDSGYVEKKIKRIYRNDLDCNPSQSIINLNVE